VNFTDLLAQCGHFFTWVEQQPQLQESVDEAVRYIEFYSGVSSSVAYQVSRDCFHSLYDCANKGGFSVVASLFYDQYVQYCRLLLEYYSFY
jgi:hypothetical protein